MTDHPSYKPIWCLALWEPIVALSEYWHDDGPWPRLWHSYVVLPPRKIGAPEQK